MLRADQHHMPRCRHLGLQGDQWSVGSGPWQERMKKEEEDREKQITDKYKVPMSRLLSYNKPEWAFFVPAILGALIEGSATPICALALGGVHGCLLQAGVRHCAGRGP